jgi:glycosyltransferase involved in cell wall biosynthesis
MNIQLSIITPVFNNRTYIEGCIQNFISQKCLVAEHIIVDGGSTDGTVDIIRNYAQQYPHIRWISERDKGQSHAMNKGIRMASGSIISFLNVDDYYNPDVFCRVLEIFKKLPEPSFVTGNCNIWDDSGQICEICRPQKMKLNDLLLGYQINPHPVNPTSYFYHKSVHDKVGLYDEEIQLAMDQEFILRMVQSVNVKYVNENWGNFRCIQGTKTQCDMQSGKIAERNKIIYATFRKRLSKLELIWLEVNTIGFWLKGMLKRVAYYLQNFHQIRAMIKRKSEKVLKTHK